MRPHSLSFRLATGTAVTALLLTQVMPVPALAQLAPPPAGAVQQQGDPPARVGRLARTAGSVSFHAAGADQWSPAAANYPVTSGDGFWTEPNAQAELQIGASRIQLAGGTDFEVGLLDDAGLQSTAGEGEIYLHLRDTRPDEAWSVQTPRGLVTLSGTGRYAIAAGDTQTPTTVTVLEGAAQISGPGLSAQVASGQTATISGDQTFQASLGPAQQDAFIAAMLQQERPPPQPAVAPPPVVASMPGGADLDAYGAWAQAPEYGPVWYPQVAADWVPYRDGHWAWVAPWGWTWVDSDPWGFAPFHYGRWVEIGGRWAWTPGAVVVAEPPVYAPALVTFFGVAAGVGIGAALASGSIGWCPLGPREAYHPWYHTSERYLREVNIRHVTNITTINRSVTVNTYVNRRAATVVPAGVMQTSRPVRQAAERVDPRALTSAHAVFGRQPVAPTRATFGVTQATARQTPLAPLPAGVTALPRHAAPGPAIRPLRPAAPGNARPLPTTLARPPLPAPQAHGTARAAVLQPGTQPGSVPLRGGSVSPGHPAPTVMSPGGRPGLATQPAPHLPPLAAPGERPTLQRPVGAGAAAPPIAHPTGPMVHPAAPPVRPSVAAPRPAINPLPQVHRPGEAPAFRAAPGVPQYHAPSPEVRTVPHALTPEVHRAPPEVHTMPQVHTAPAPVHVAPQFHPVPQPQVHAAPPPAHVAPQFHPAPPPQMHAAPPPAQHSQQEREKRPGEH